MVKRAAINVQKIQIPVMEHNPHPASLTPSRIANFKGFQDALNRNGIYRIQSVQCSPLDLGLFNEEVLQTLRNGHSSGFAKWQTFSNHPTYSYQFFLPSDTVAVRQAQVELLNIALGDFYRLNRTHYWPKALVTDAGVVGVWMGKVLKDMGTNIIETTQSGPNALGWVFTSSTAPNVKYHQYIIPGDGRTILVRPTYNPGEASTFAGFITSIAGANQAVSTTMGYSFMNNLCIPTLGSRSLYWHTSAMMLEDPFAQWVYGDFMGAVFRQYSNVLMVDRTFLGQSGW